MHNDQILRVNAPTPQEVIMWKYLRRSNLGYKFRRQHSIGYYIADFCCPEKKIIIEVDGQQHLKNIEYDQERTGYLVGLGYRVLRFWNKYINTNLKKVLDEILLVLNTTPQSPPFQGGEEDIECIS